jgi:hypothetical protein
MHHPAVAAVTARPAAAALSTPAPSPSQNTTASVPAGIWPAADTTTLGGAAVMAAPTSPPATTEHVVESDPNEILDGRHQVEAAVPSEAGAADLASKAHRAAASAQMPNSGVAAVKPVARAMLAGAFSPDQIGSTSWIAQVLAALGGALAAGIVAWFLIWPFARRTYG